MNISKIIFILAMCTVSNLMTSQSIAYETRLEIQKKQSVVNTPNRHSFVMTGTKTLFLSHLTMLHTEDHMYQVVLRVTIPEHEMKIYLNDQKQHPKKTYFLGNDMIDQFTLNDLKSGVKSSFSASIWRGIPNKQVYEYWPWRDQKPIIKNILLKIEQVVYFRHFDFNNDYPNSLTYILFGSGNESYLYHYQTKQPDFDQVISLKKSPKWISSRQLETGILINIPKLPSTPVFCSNPLSRKRYVVQYYGVEGYGGGKLPKFKIRIDRNYWFSTKITNLHNPCVNGKF